MINQPLMWQLRPLDTGAILLLLLPEQTDVVAQAMVLPDLQRTPPSQLLAVLGAVNAKLSKLL